jgi:hypothetical protein
MTTAREQLEKAKKLRNQRYYTILACILVGVIVAVVVAALKVFPSIPDHFIVTIGFGGSVLLANLIYQLQIRNIEKPKCPACGTEWEIIEGGARFGKGISANATACPKCGVEI